MSILKKLQEKSIFKIETADKFFGKQGRYTEEDMIKYDFNEQEKEQWRNCNFVMTEKCDDYYNFPISKEELKQLGNELIELSKA